MWWQRILGYYIDELWRYQQTIFYISDNILNNVTKTYLDHEGFQKYFSALASDKVAIKGTGYSQE